MESVHRNGMVRLLVREDIGKNTPPHPAQTLRAISERESLSRVWT